MLPGKVVGRVVATSKVESLRGIKLLLVQPCDWNRNPEGDYIIAADSVGAGYNEYIFYVEARDAVFPFPTEPPLDATIVGIIDDVYMPE